MRRTALALVAALLGAGAVAGAIVFLTGDRDTEVAASVLVNQPGQIEVHNSPTVARNPRRAEDVVVVHRIDRPGFSASLDWSDDGGSTWQPTELALPPGVPTCAAPLAPGRACPFGPDAAFGPDGTLYVLYVNLEGQGNVPTNLWLATSTDGGRTLSEPVRVAGELTFQPRLAVGDDGTVHVTWVQVDAVGLFRFVGPARVVAVRSTDRGQTFSEPATVSDAERERVGAASPVVGGDGDLVVLYEDFKGDRRDFENLEGPPAEEPFALVVTRSDDGGRSFSAGVELESDVVATRRFLVFLPEFPSLAAGSGQTLYVAWADGRNGDEDVFLRRSDDGGGTWTDAVRVNDNPVGDGTDQYLPKAAVAPDGRVDVLFYDRRRDPENVGTDAFLATSDDGGSSFENLRVSSTSFDSRIGPTLGEQYGTDLGARLGLVAGSGASLAAWTDTRMGSEATGRQDVLGAVIDQPASTPLLARPPVVAGLLVAGILALGGWWATTRRAAGAP
ncbi:MAG: hypothetical protein ACRDZ9_09900 [Acidimicrobiales bacterium]